MSMKCFLLLIGLKKMAGLGHVKREDSMHAHLCPSLSLFLASPPNLKLSSLLPILFSHACLSVRKDKLAKKRDGFGRDMVYNRKKGKERGQTHTVNGEEAKEQEQGIGSTVSGKNANEKETMQIHWEAGMCVYGEDVRNHGQKCINYIRHLLTESGEQFVCTCRHVNKHRHAHTDIFLFAQPCMYGT